LLWDKGLDHLLRLEYFYKAITGEFFPIDIVGDGPDRADIEAAFKAETRTGKIAKTIRKLLSIDDDDSRDQSLEFSVDQLEAKKPTNSLYELPSSMLLHTDRVPGTFHGRKDHAQFCTKYRVLVNPSTTEVLCTTVAEALAMGKFVIIPKHPSNGFFYQFPNCLVYENKVEFVKHMFYALTNEPEPLSPEHAHIFTWEAATERLAKASAITMKEGRARAKAKKEGLNKHIAKTYNKLGARGDLLRMILDGPNSADSAVQSPDESDDNEQQDG
jgi:glycosyltransferase involved in cell wall biosynthesis